MDVILVAFVGLVFYGGIRRGLILEFFDWMILALGCMAAFGAYRPMAGLLGFLGWKQESLYALCFFFIFVAVAAILVVIGLILDRNYKHTLPKGVNETSGGFLALFKGLVLAYILVLVLWQLPFDRSFRRSMRGAPVVQAVQNGVSQPVFAFLHTFTAREVARDQVQALKKARF